ncbi:MAG: exo-alpha-sialidase, partial [Planctomycetes bacterium]|nr:exo-alpha-sialidase [Planctomycetota bacterium]
MGTFRAEKSARNAFWGLTVWAVALLGPAAAQETALFVEDGKPLACEQVGGTWRRGDGFLSQQGTGRHLNANRAAGPGDLHVRVRITLETLQHTAASFVFDDRSHFGFDGGDLRFFTQGPLFGKTRFLGKATDHVTPKKPFDFEIIRRGKEMTFLIDGTEVHRVEVGDGPLGTLGLRPWRSTMRVYSFTATGNLVDPPARPTKPKWYSIPGLDLSGQTERHVIIARGTEDVYQGHPHTLLMPDGKTVFAVWTYNHGGACGPMKRSDDGGRTWSELVDVPENWATVPNCPTIHRLVAPDGKARLVVFAGNGPMHQSISDDDGATWTPMTPNGLKCVVAPMTVMPVEGGTRYRMWVHRGPDDRDRSPLTIWQADSADGGLTWDRFVKVCEVPGADPCEPCVIRSPNGRQLLMLMRENRRRFNSLYATSDDEGRTWSEAKELSAALTGDRHAARYAPDGRLVVVMRDMAAESPTRGHFVAWIGTYDDVLAGREGQYRVKLLNQNGRLGDCGYPGLELLPDGSFLAVTYCDYEPGPEKNSVVGGRFRLEEIDEQARRLPNQQPLWRSGVDGYDTYRIPALAVTNQRTVLAFCEGRKGGRGDSGDIDMLVKRSTDAGRTWSDQAIVWDDAANTCGNPCPVVDRQTGDVWLLMTWNRGDDRESQIIAQTSNDTRRVFVTRSTDDGLTWAEPKEITAQTKLPTWTWYATGPGAGIQITRGSHQGRLIIPCDHIEADTGHYYSHVVYSDDHGQTWKLGGSTPEHQVNECLAVELTGGRLMLNMRNYDRAKHRRQVALSDDGGLTWTDQRFEPAMIEPICQAGIRRYSWPDNEDPGVILFSNPANEKQRVNMTVRLSFDDGATWPVAKPLHAGPSAYSDLAALPDRQIGCLYEGG